MSAFTIWFLTNPLTFVLMPCCIFLCVAMHSSHKDCPGSLHRLILSIKTPLQPLLSIHSIGCCTFWHLLAVLSWTFHMIYMEGNFFFTFRHSFVEISNRASNFYNSWNELALLHWQVGKLTSVNYDILPCELHYL